jgi:histidyl-tRNA synthetase
LAEKSEAPIGVIVGEEEIASNNVRIKQLGTKVVGTEGELVDRSKMVQEVIDLLRGLED